jgi:hypothetical protein
MPIVTTEEIPGFKTCGRDRVAAARRGEGECPGYTSESANLLREVVAYTYGDAHGDTSDPYYRIVEKEIIRLIPATPEDGVCAHCGFRANVSLEAREDYPRLADKGPDELVRRATADRDRAHADEQAHSVAERQAIATERLVEQQAQTNVLLRQQMELGMRTQSREERQREMAALLDDKPSDAGTDEAARAGPEVASSAPTKPTAKRAPRKDAA